MPRFEPSGRATPPEPQTPPQIPSVSFTEPTPRPSSALSEVDVPETDEPAYAPRVELSLRSPDDPGPTRVPPGRGTPTTQDAPAFASPQESTPTAPARPWSAVTDDDVEFAAPTILHGTGLPTEMAPEADSRASSDRPPEPVWDAPTGPPTSYEGATVPPATAPELDAEDHMHGLADESPTGEHDVTATAPRKRRRWIWWVILALLVASAAGVVVYTMYLRPEPITLPVPTVTAPPATPVGEPMAIPDPTDFVAALPDTVETDVLMAYTNIDPATETDLPARVAEHHRLSYGTGTGAPHFVVNAYQHYTVEAAEQAYDFWATEDADVEPVLVDGEQVGDRALTTEGDAGKVVWRNTTALFVLNGGDESVLDFYEHFGV